MNYSEKLKDPRWQKRRLDVLCAANWACEDCGRRDLELHVHHCAYIRAMQPWEYGLELLMCVCGPCHTFRQQHEDGLRVALGKVTRFLSKNNLEAEAWKIIHEIQLRETQRNAKAFNPDEE